MPDKIILNSNEFKIGEDRLPCLVNYASKQGGSHLTMVMVANMFLLGSKILILTAYPMAKDKFCEQIGGENKNVAFAISESEIETNKDKQVIILESGNEQLFEPALSILDDINDRVILVKNMEQFSDQAVELCKPFSKTILSGDMSNCPGAKKLFDQGYFKSVISFDKPDLEKYHGFYQYAEQEGMIRIGSVSNQ